MIRRSIAVLALAAPIAACPTPPFEHPPGPPRIERFHATPFAITRGDSTLLEWDVSRATQVLLVGLGGPGADPSADRTPVDPSGRRSLAPASSLEVRLIAIGPGGSSEAWLDIDVLEPELVAIDRFEVLPARARAGDPVEITWSTRNARQVVLELSNGQVLDAEAPPAGSLILRPERDVTVRLRADGHGGPARAERTVSIIADRPWIAELSISPPEISRTETATLSWRVIGPGASVTLKEDGVPILDPAPANGSLIVSGAGGSRVFLIEASNGSGASQATVELEVLPEPPPEIVSLTVTPTITGPGGQVIVAYETRHADELLLRGGAASYSLPPGSGSFLLDPPSGARELALYARSTFLSATATATHPLVIDSRRPDIVGLVALPNPFVRGQVVQVTWSVRATDFIELATEAGTVLLTSADATGMITFAPVRSLVLVLTASSARGGTRRWLPLEAL